MPRNPVLELDCVVGERGRLEEEGETEIGFVGIGVDGRILTSGGSSAGVEPALADAVSSGGCTGEISALGPPRNE